MDIKKKFREISKTLTSLSNEVVDSQVSIQDQMDQPDEDILPQIADSIYNISTTVYSTIVEVVKDLHQLKRNYGFMTEPQITRFATEQALEERAKALRDRNQARYERDVAIQSLAYFMANKKNMKKDVYWDNTEHRHRIMARQDYTEALRLMQHVEKKNARHNQG